MKPQMSRRSLLAGIGAAPAISLVPASSLADHPDAELLELVSRWRTAEAEALAWAAAHPGEDYETGDNVLYPVDDAVREIACTPARSRQDVLLKARVLNECWRTYDDPNSLQDAIEDEKRDPHVSLAASLVLDLLELEAPATA